MEFVGHGALPVGREGVADQRRQGPGELVRDDVRGAGPRQRRFQLGRVLLPRFSMRSIRPIRSVPFQFH